MEIQEFIDNFANLFDDTDESEFKAETQFHDLEEWDSLNALAVLNLADRKYNVILKSEDLLTTNTIQELFDLIKSKL